MQTIKPQELMKQTWQMLIDNPEHLVQYVLWHDEYSHCFGGLSDLILRGLSVKEPVQKVISKQCPAIFDRVQEAYGFTEETLHMLTTTENTIGVLESYTEASCNPLSSIKTFNYGRLMFLLSRPDIEKDIAIGAINRFLIECRCNDEGVKNLIDVVENNKALTLCCSDIASLLSGLRSSHAEDSDDD